MTAYFDDRHMEVHRVPVEDYYAAGVALDTIERQVVFDCTVAAMFSGFPADLKEQIHRTVLDRGLGSLPVNAVSKVEPETLQDHKRAVDRLIWDLHSVFHSVAQRGLDGFSDDPRTPLRVLYARGEEEREVMCQTNQP